MKKTETTKTKILKPFGKYIMVKPLINQTSKSGIIIVAKEEEQPFKGSVVALGDGKYTVEINDEIVFKKFAGYPIDVDGELHIVMTEEDILAVVK